MIQANDIVGRKNQIKDYLIAGNMERAIPKLIDWTRDIAPDTEEEDLAITISFKFNNNKKSFNNDEITDEQKNISNTKLVRQILQLMREVTTNLSDYERAA